MKSHEAAAWWPVVLALILIGAGLRQPLPPHPSTATGLPALAYTGLSLGLWAHLVLLAAALGRRVWHAFRFPSLPPRELWLWTLPTGLTLLGYPVYALGLLGLLRRTWLAALLLLLTLFLHREMDAFLREGLRGIRRWWTGWPRASRGVKTIWAGGILLLGGSFLMALTPPWLYDALWYHLQAPRLFLEAGRIYPEWNNWPANYAFAVNMLYALPMALGSDVTPRLLQWTYGLVFLILLYELARPEAGVWAWLAPAFLLTMPGFLITLAPSALIDVAAATLELMAYGALLRANRQRDIAWFWASALWAGLTASVKMAALPVLATVAVVWLWKGFQQGFTQRLLALVRYGAFALALMTPWYLKNWFWFGTPVFPSGMKGGHETLLRAHFFSAYTMTAEVKGWRRLIFLLWLITQPQKMGYTPPPFALPLLLLLFLQRITWWPEIPLIIGVRTLVWAAGPPRPRFLLATWGLGGIGLVSLVKDFTSPRWYFRVLARGTMATIVVFLFLNSGLEVLTLWGLRPWQVALGWESQEAFLARRVDGYQAWKYLKSHLAQEDSILLVGDTRHYYCPPQCYPEADHFTWTRIVLLSNFQTEDVIRHLSTLGITHLWLHRSSMTWLQNHDVHGWVQRSYDFLYRTFMPACTQIQYQDQDILLLRLTCG